MKRPWKRIKNIITYHDILALMFTIAMIPVILALVVVILLCGIIAMLVEMGAGLSKRCAGAKALP